jgi:hypothetical protein
MMLMRRFAGTERIVGVEGQARGEALHQQHAVSGRPPATSSRRDALPRSLDSSQLL